MPAIVRACGTLFVCLLFVAASGAQSSDPWQAAPRSVVRAVQSKAESPSAISLTVNNASSLPVASFEQFKFSLRSALSEAGIRVVAPERALADVLVTVSEDVSGYLCVAEIEHSGQRDVAMLPVARGNEPLMPQMASAITLRKTLLWSQSGADTVLDVALLKDGKALLVLDSAIVSLFRNQDSRWQLVQSQTVTHSHPWPRDVRGRLLMHGGGKFDAYLPGVKCSGSADSSLAMTCNASDDPWPVGSESSRVRAFFGARNFFTGALTGVAGMNSVAPFYSTGVVPGSDSQILFASTDDTLRHLNGRPAGIETGSDLAAVKSDCGAGWQLLFSGTGDRTQADSIRAADFASGSPALVGAPLEFDAPVTALWTASDGASAVAVTRNDASGVSGIYEAYAISVACH